MKEKEKSVCFSIENPTEISIIGCGWVGVDRRRYPHPHPPEDKNIFFIQSTFSILTRFPLKSMKSPI